MPPNNRPRPKPLTNPTPRIIPIAHRLLIPSQSSRNVGVDSGDESVADGGGGGVEGGGHPDLPVGFGVGVSGVEGDAVGSWMWDDRIGARMRMGKEREGGEGKGGRTFDGGVPGGFCRSRGERTLVQAVHKEGTLTTYGCRK